MDINNEAIRAIAEEFAGLWTAAWNNPTKNDFIALVTEYTSSGAGNDYAMLEQMQGWREWYGARKFEDIKSDTYRLANRTFEKSITIPREDIEDDQIGIYSPLVAQMVEGYQQLIVELIIDDVLVANPTAYDGTALFSESRTYGSHTIDNATSAVFSSAAFSTAMETMQSYMFHNDRPGLVRPTLLIVGPAYEQTAWDVVVNQLTASSNASVQNFNAARGVVLMISPWLSGDNEDLWFLADTTKAVGPIILQRRAGPETQMSDAETVMRTNVLDYMARARLAVGPGVPHLIYGGGRTDL